MSKIKQFKVARRLGAPIFPKCDHPKFSLAPKIHGTGKGRRPQRSEYGTQLLEKQKARFSYGLSEKQFSNYVKDAMAKVGVKPTEDLYISLETRLDNVVYRLGLTKTRRFARQMVSHGHIMVNGKKVTIPSFRVKKGDEISIREQSTGKRPFEDLASKLKDHKFPAWLSFDEGKKSGSVLGAPVLDENLGIVFDLVSVIEFYSR